jgi:hypothetical protein
VIRDVALEQGGIVVVAGGSEMARGNRRGIDALARGRFVEAVETGAGGNEQRDCIRGRDVQGAPFLHHAAAFRHDADPQVELHALGVRVLLVADGLGRIAQVVGIDVRGRLAGH